jgi:hypothetical protein
MYFGEEWWFFAAIPVGFVSVVTGLIARRRVHTYDDPRAASRATIGTALGCVAILLGMTGAYFLPRIIDRGIASSATCRTTSTRTSTW